MGILGVEIANNATLHTKLRPLHILTLQKIFKIHMLRWPCGLCYIGKTSRPLKTQIAKNSCAIRYQD